MTGRRKIIFDKITSKVEITDEGCWLYRGPTSGTGRGGGYGRICIDGGTVAVHRAMFCLVHGPIPPRKQVDHTCRNRLCCNPAHLELVTHKQNQHRRDQARCSPQTNCSPSANSDTTPTPAHYLNAM